MRRFLYYILSAAIMVSCAMNSTNEPYSEESLNELTITVSYPDEFADLEVESNKISITDIDRGNSYSTTVGDKDAATIKLTNGRYMIQFSGKYERTVFNATADQVLLADKDVAISLSATASLASDLVIKEIYCGGCMKTPEEGAYHFDKYVTLHNNSSETVYLDGLCYGVLDPYNSNSTNIWVTTDPDTGETIFADELYLVQAVWQFGGDGTTFPLAPGEDAVVCNNGAIDHESQYPLSVNLNKEGYFVLYDNVNFPLTTCHPAPGDNISPDRYLKVAIKLGVSSGWVFSNTSPAPVFFRPYGTTIEEYLAEDGNVFQKPGSNVDKIVRVPIDWVVDGVEVFNGGSSTNKKRFSPAVDAGFISLSGTDLGKTLHRNIDQEASDKAGYDIYFDTNNSSSDFYERSKSSLKDE